MKCRNCLNEIPEHATACMYCEAKVGASISPERIEAIRQMQSAMPPEIRQAMAEMVQQYNTAEDFVAAVMMGQCPKCGSESVRDCEGVMGLDDTTVGMCLDCGQRWCLACGYLLRDQNDTCPHWAICEDCPTGQQGGCTMDPSQCTWLKDQMNGRIVHHLLTIPTPSDTPVPENWTGLSVTGWRCRSDDRTEYCVHMADGREGVLYVWPKHIELALPPLADDKAGLDSFEISPSIQLPPKLVREISRALEDLVL